MSPETVEEVYYPTLRSAKNWIFRRMIETFTSSFPISLKHTHLFEGEIHCLTVLFSQIHGIAWAVCSCLELLISIFVDASTIKESGFNIRYLIAQIR